MAYVAGTESENFVVVDGKVGPAFEEIVADTLVFSPNGEHVAFGGVSKGKFSMMQDGKSLGEYDGVGPASFSSDGKHIAFRAGIGSQSFIFVDGTPVPRFTGIVCEPIFRKDGVLEFLSVDAGILYRVTSKAFLPTP